MTSPVYLNGPRMPPPAVPLPPHKLLPKDVQAALMRVRNIEPGIAAGESISRTMVLESVIRHAKMKYPKLFNPKP